MQRSSLLVAGLAGAALAACAGTAPSSSDPVVIGYDPHLAKQRRRDGMARLPAGRSPFNRGSGGGAERQALRLAAKAEANRTFYAAIPPASHYPLPKPKAA